MISVFVRLFTFSNQLQLHWNVRHCLRLCTATCIACSLIFLTACEEEQEKIETLETEVALLKNSLRDLKDRIQGESERTDNFNHRIETTEQQSKDALDQASNAILQQATRFKRMEEGVAQIAKIQQKRESQAYLKIGQEGHTPIRTTHGTFLIRVGKLDPIPDGGSLVHLVIGNSLGLTVQQFVLKGDFGGPAPKLEPGEKYEFFSQRLDDWQKTLTPFEVTINTELKPDRWTKATFNLPIANNKSSIELLRLSMSINKALLNEKDQFSDYSITSINSKNATMLKSQYGSFLLAIDNFERQEGGVLIYARIANPIGYTIARSELEGWFGPNPPTRIASESTQDFVDRFKIWNDNLKPFKIPISTRLKPDLWTPISFVMPADESHLNYIRLKFNVQGVAMSQERRIR